MASSRPPRWAVDLLSALGSAPSAMGAQQGPTQRGKHASRHGASSTQESSGPGQSKRLIGAWGCTCGVNDNYASRKTCRGCGRLGPRSFAGAAGAAKPAPSQPRPAAQAAAVVPPEPNASGAAVDAEGDATMTEPAATARLAGVRARIAALRPFEEYSGTVEALELEAAELVAQQKEERPLLSRLQSASTICDKAVAAADEAQRNLEDLKARIGEAESVAKKAHEHARVARAKLDAVRAEVAAVQQPQPSPEVPGRAQAAVVLGSLETLIADHSSSGGVPASPSCADGVMQTRIAALLQELRALLTAAPSVPEGQPSSAPPQHGSQSGQMHQGASGGTLPAQSPSARPVGTPGPLPSVPHPVHHPGVRSPRRHTLDDSDDEDARMSASSGCRSRSRLRREELEREDLTRQTTQDIAAGRQRTLGHYVRTASA